MTRRSLLDLIFCCVCVCVVPGSKLRVSKSMGSVASSRRAVVTASLSQEVAAGGGATGAGDTAADPASCSLSEVATSKVRE